MGSAAGAREGPLKSNAPPIKLDAKPDLVHIQTHEIFRRRRIGKSAIIVKRIVKSASFAASDLSCVGPPIANI
jgi:hypothetical protein